MVFLIISSLFLLLLAVLLFSALRLGKGQPLSTQDIISIPADSEDIIARFRRAIQIPTVTHSDYSLNDETQFVRFQDFLMEEFESFFRDCQIERFAAYGLAIRWPATAKQADAMLGGGSKLPILYTAHYDVVPVEGQQWSVEPFAAERKDGMIWGRGTLDTKNSLMAILESAAALHKSGFQPDRDIWFAFGGDEETASTQGAVTISRWFASKKIQFDWIFDEGGIIAKDMVPGIKGNAALIGIAEKGHVNIRLESDSDGGHSSTPPTSTALGRVARAVHLLETSKRPNKLPQAMGDFFRGGAPFQKFPLKIVMANLWLFTPLLKLILLKSPNTRAMLHSTVAPTMAAGSSKENVLPVKAWANINVRVAVHETVDSVLQRFRRIVNDDRVRLSIADPDDTNDPVLPSSVNGQAQRDFFDSVAQSLKSHSEVFAVLPYLMTGATDSKYYAAVSNAVYRFVPMVLDSKQLALIHSPDERISEENYFRMIAFYTRHMQLEGGGQQ